MKKKEKEKPKRRYIYKSAITGEIVSEKFARENPDTTFHERINLAKYRTDAE